MRLIVNGRPGELPAGTTVAGLLADPQLEHVRVAVELNREVVRRKDFDRITLKEGDCLEIVTLVGGG